MRNNIAQTIKETREAYGESQEDFASRLGCSRVSLSNYENGKTSPSANIYEKVLQLLQKKRH